MTLDAHIRRERGTKACDIGTITTDTKRNASRPKTTLSLSFCFELLSELSCSSGFSNDCEMYFICNHNEVIIEVNAIIASQG